MRNKMSRMEITIWMAGLAILLRLASVQGNDTDIVAQWHFDEGTGKAAQDSSDNNNHGEFMGNPQWGKGISGTAIALDGASNVRVTTGRPLGIEKTATMEAWIKPENEDGRILMKNINVKGADLNFILRCTGPRYGLPTRGLVFGVRATPEKGPLPVDSEVELWDGKWHHVVVTCDGNMMKMYVDGRLDFAAVEQYEGTIDPGIAPLFIGGYGQMHGQFKGMIDEVTIWKRALTGEEIRQRYDKLKSSQ